MSSSASASSSAHVPSSSSSGGTGTASSSSSSLQSSEFLLNNPPSDGITALAFNQSSSAASQSSKSSAPSSAASASSDLLLVSSWDSSLRLYDINFNLLKLRVDFDAPTLDCVFDSRDDNRGFVVGMDENVTAVDFNTGTKSVMGKHSGVAGTSSAHANKPGPPPASSCLALHPESHTLFSGGWDGRLQGFDLRAPKAVVSLTLAEGEKIMTMSTSGSRIVLGTNRRQVFIYDVRMLGSGAGGSTNPEQKRESSLLNQTRCIRGFPDTTGYALSSIEGRVAIEYFNPAPEIQAKKYAFKCHRRLDVESGKNILYPVNALAFHPRYGTFATGGCDGLVNVWDGANKKRICQYPAKSTSIAALAFSASGDRLAVAASYTWEQGERDHPPDAIYIRTVHQHEVMPKQQRSATGTAAAAPTPTGVFAQPTRR